MTVPNQVSHNFEANMVLDHVNARKKEKVLITFVGDAAINPRRTDAQANEHYSYAQQGTSSNQYQ